MKKYMLLLVLGISATLFSCSDDDQPAIPKQNQQPVTQNDTIPKLPFVTAKTWRLTGFTQGAPGSTAHQDLYDTALPKCQKDDMYTFALVDKLTVSPGNIKCTSSDTDQIGTWNLSNDSALFTINNPAQTITGLTGEFSVVEITATKIMITRVLNGSQYTLTFTAI